MARPPHDVERCPTTYFGRFVFLSNGGPGHARGYADCHPSGCQAYGKGARNVNVWARWTCDLLFQDNAKGLSGFMIGRAAKNALPQSKVEVSPPK
jgi:hypothetical protein